jgi:hypothetical protein
MKLTVTIPPAQLRDFIPSAETLAEAMGQGIETLLRAHLHARDRARPPRGNMPKSSFYANAADTIDTRIEGASATVEIGQTGVSLHYYGGVIYPTGGRKALAIPKHPAVHDEKPSTFDPGRTRLTLVWNKMKKVGVLKSKDAGEVFFLLIPRASIPADETVLPNDNDIAQAAIAEAERLIKK